MKQISLLGSKSIAQRALVCAALANGPSTLLNYPSGDDAHVLLHALNSCGLSTQSTRLGLHVTPPSEWPNTDIHIDVGHGGFPARVLTALLPLLPGQHTLTGSARLRQRPLRPLVHALQAVGLQVHPKSETHPLPLTTHGPSTYTGQPIQLGVCSSSQFLTAAMLILPAFGGGRVTWQGSMPSWPYVTLTAHVMQAFGAHLTFGDHWVDVSGTYTPVSSYVIEPDAASAGYLLGASMLSGVPVFIPGLTPTSPQPDAALTPILQRMGADITFPPQGITCHGAHTLRSPGEVDCAPFPDAAPMLAVLAAFCPGQRTTLTGLETLPHKESHRLNALVTELKKMGIHAHSTASTLTIHGGTPHPAHIHTYHDHRIGLAFGMATLRLPDLLIDVPDVVTKSFPGYWTALASLKSV